MKLLDPLPAKKSIRKRRKKPGVVPPRVQASNESSLVRAGLRNGIRVGERRTVNDSSLLVESHSQFPSLARFPEYGSEGYHRECSWVLPRAKRHTYDNCTLLAKLYDKGTEGVSDWANKVVETHQLAVLTNCLLLVDYGVNNVDLQQVFTLASSEENWTVPHGYNCKMDATCIQAKGIYGIENQNLTKLNGKEVATVPQYRMAYVERDHPQHFYRDSYLDLRKRLPGLFLESAMACSMRSLLKLAPTASQYEPTLFTDILPTLHQKDTLVICLYIRTHRTDYLVWDEEQQTQKVNSNAARHEKGTESALACAQHLEQEYLNAKNTAYTKAVWMVMTDAPYLKTSISQKHSTESRTIITTSSRGVILDRSGAHPCKMFRKLSLIGISSENLLWL